MVLRRVEHEEMGTGRVTSVLVAMAIPAAAGGLLNCLYTLVDMAFIGWLGKAELNAVSTVMSPRFIIFALGRATSVGVTALVSRHLGAGDPARARRVLNHALGMAVCVGAAIALLGMTFSTDLLRLFRPPEDVLGLASDYFTIIVAATMLTHLGLVSEAGLRAQGNTITPMKVMMTANVVNALIDPLFIFGPGDVGSFGPNVAWLFDPLAPFGLGLGVKGAAYATFLTQGFMAVALLSRLWAKKTRLKPSVPWRALAKPRFHVVSSIYALGLPFTVGHLGMSVSFAIVVGLLNQLDPNAVGVMGIGVTLERFAFVPIFGLFSAVMPIVGYNLGALNLDRCKETIKSGCRVASTAMAAVGAVMVVWPGMFIRMFNSSPDILVLGSSYMRINCCVYALIGCEIIMAAGFQGLGYATYSMFCQIWRTLIARIPLVYLFAHLWGITGVWWSFTASNIICVAISTWLMLNLLKKLEKDFPARLTPGVGGLKAISAKVPPQPDTTPEIP